MIPRRLASSFGPFERRLPCLRDIKRQEPAYSTSKHSCFLNYIHISIIIYMKPVRFLGDSLKCLRGFPEDAMQDAGYQLDKVQRGNQPDDFKPMPSIGKGVEEIRVWDDTGTYG